MSERSHFGPTSREFKHHKPTRTFNHLSSWQEHRERSGRFGELDRQSWPIGGVHESSALAAQRHIKASSQDYTFGGQMRYERRPDDFIQSPSNLHSRESCQKPVVSYCQHLVCFQAECPEKPRDIYSPNRVHLNKQTNCLFGQNSIESLDSLATEEQNNELACLEFAYQRGNAITMREATNLHRPTEFGHSPQRTYTNGGHSVSLNCNQHPMAIRLNEYQQQETHSTGSLTRVAANKGMSCGISGGQRTALKLLSAPVNPNQNSVPIEGHLGLAKCLGPNCNLHEARWAAAGGSSAAGAAIGYARQANRMDCSEQESDCSCSNSISCNLSSSQQSAALGAFQSVVQTGNGQVLAPASMMSSPAQVQAHRIAADSHDRSASQFNGSSSGHHRPMGIPVPPPPQLVRHNTYSATPATITDATLSRQVSSAAELHIQANKANSDFIPANTNLHIETNQHTIVDDGQASGPKKMDQIRHHQSSGAGKQRQPISSRRSQAMTGEQSQQQQQQHQEHNGHNNPIAKPLAGQQQVHRQRSAAAPKLPSSIPTHPDSSSCERSNSRQLHSAPGDRFGLGTNDLHHFCSASSLEPHDLSLGPNTGEQLIPKVQVNPAAIRQANLVTSAGVATYPPVSPLPGQSLPFVRQTNGAGLQSQVPSSALASNYLFDPNCSPLPPIISHRTNSPWMRISSIILTPIGLVIILFIVVSPLLHYIM